MTDKIRAWAATAPKSALTCFAYAPAALGDEEVEIAISHCGICHSDLSMLDNDWGNTSYPLVAGHEAIGTIAALGAHAKGLHVGQRVGLGWMAGSCMHCKQCMSGHHNLCRTGDQTIVGRHGGFADRVRCHWSWAIALPDVIIAKFGVPQALFAPNPGRRKLDQGQLYHYIRPLATIEPLAIRVGLPVDVRYGFDNATQVAHALQAPDYANKTVVVAWEHFYAARLLRDLVKRQGGDPKQVADWDGGDFDRMDVVEITRVKGTRPVVTYVHGEQGLNGISSDCPRGK